MIDKRKNLVILFDLNKYDYLLEDAVKYSILEERNKAGNYQAPQDKYQLLSYIIRRLILSYLLDISPLDIEFKYNEYGKPSEKEDRISFSISHSTNYLALAIASDYNLGVDIEVNKYIPKLNSFLNSFLTSQEKKNVKNQLDSSQELITYMYWTMKESIVKALGKGLQIDMKTIELINLSNSGNETLNYTCKIAGKIIDNAITSLLIYNDEKEVISAVTLYKNNSLNMRNNEKSEVIKLQNPKLDKDYFCDILKYKS